VAGCGFPGAEEVRAASWVHVAPRPTQPDPVLVQNCRGLGSGETSAILLAACLSADVILLDERKARRVAAHIGLRVVGCVGVLEAGARAGRITDLRSVYVDLLRQGIRFDLAMLSDSLTRLGFPRL